MQCPRCSELVSDQSTECPVCHKSLTPSLPGPGLRLTLTGDYIEQPTASTNSLSSVSSVSSVGQAGAGNTNSAPKTAPVPEAPPPLRIVTVNADLNANLRESARQSGGKMPVSGTRIGDAMRWVIVLLALVGSVAGGYLWLHPVVAPIAIHLPAGNVPIEGTLVETRSIPVPYLWLWGIYFLLAVATQVFLPSPWRLGYTRVRTNWVLNITGLYTLLLFCSMGMFQGGANLFQDEGVTISEGGSYTVSLNGTSQQLPKSEAEHLVARTVAARERATFTQWNLAALVCYVSLGGYGAWWLLTRPSD